jgi:hypothetical protein
MEPEQRRHLRFDTVLSVRFNLNPDHHFVPRIRTMGVGGTVRNISSEGLLIDSQLDVLDVCQIFPEAIDDDSAFELELQFSDPRDRRLLIRGVVRWYRLSAPEEKTRYFQAGLYLRDDESRAIAKGIIQSIRMPALN